MSSAYSRFPEKTFLQEDPISFIISLHVKNNIRDKDAKLGWLLEELTFLLVDLILSSNVRVGKQLCSDALKAEMHSWVMHRIELQRHVRAMFRKAAIHANRNSIYIVYMYNAKWNLCLFQMPDLQSRERIYCMCDCVNHFSKSPEASSYMIQNIYRRYVFRILKYVSKIKQVISWIIL